MKKVSEFTVVYYLLLLGCKHILINFCGFSFLLFFPLGNSPQVCLNSEMVESGTNNKLLTLYLPLEKAP